MNAHDRPSAFPEGPTLGSLQGTDVAIGHVQRQVPQVIPNAVACVIQTQLEPVHDAEHGSIGGLGEARLGHGSAVARRTRTGPLLDWFRRQHPKGSVAALDNQAIATRTVSGWVQAGS